MLTRERAVAELVAAQARTAERSDVDSFSDLVLKYSEDRLSGQRGMQGG